MHPYKISINGERINAKTTTALPEKEGNWILNDVKCTKEMKETFFLDQLAISVKLEGQPTWRGFGFVIQLEIDTEDDDMVLLKRVVFTVNKTS